MTIATGSPALASDILKSLDADGHAKFANSTILTIAVGAITITQNWHRVDTEAAAATDDLDTINKAANMGDGTYIFLRASADNRTVVIKHGTGNIVCTGGVDFSLDTYTDVCLLVWDGNLSKWCAQMGGKLGVGQVTSSNLADGAVTDAKLRNSAGLSVIGRSAATAGPPADIPITASYQVLREAAGAIAFGTVATGGIANDAVDITKIGNQVPGVSGRQGGDAANWSVPGTTNYTPTAVRIQGGAVSVNTNPFDITFPVAFSNVPLVFISELSTPTAYVALKTASMVRIAGITGTAALEWLAIGPE